jgi:hypothetical protein
MKAWFAHRSGVVRRRLADGPPDRAEPLAGAGRACCCPARPVVTVVMPSAPGRPHPVDLLLCGHHYRVCRPAAAAAGAGVYDELGAPVRTGAGGYELARREPAGTAPRR